MEHDLILLVSIGVVYQMFEIKRSYENNHVRELVFKINIICSYALYVISKFHDYELGLSIADRILMLSISTKFAINAVNQTTLPHKKHIY